MSTQHSIKTLIDRPSAAIICMHMHAYAYACICMHMLAYANICLHMYAYECICMHMRTASPPPNLNHWAPQQTQGGATIMVGGEGGRLVTCS